MTERREHIKGMTDPRLEVRPTNGTRNWRDKVTPTQDGDISERAKAYKSLMHGAADHKQVMAGTGHDATNDFYRQSADALRAIRRDVVVLGFNLPAFDMMVRDEVTLREQKAAEEAEDERVAGKVVERERDWMMIRTEFPGQYDAQAAIDHGEGTIVNFGNHAKKSDAGGFEPRRRGW